MFVPRFTNSTLFARMGGASGLNCNYHQYNKFVNLAAEKRAPTSYYDASLELTLNRRDADFPWLLTLVFCASRFVLV